MFSECSFFSLSNRNLGEAPVSMYSQMNIYCRSIKFIYFFHNIIKFVSFKISLIFTDTDYECKVQAYYLSQFPKSFIKIIRNSIEGDDSGLILVRRWGWELSLLTREFGLTIWPRIGSGLMLGLCIAHDNICVELATVLVCLFKHRHGGHLDCLLACRLVVT